jgi:outer membrane receptor protein involved in Fe transport
MGIYPNVSLSRANGNNAPDSVGPNGSVIQPSDRVRFEELYNHLLGRISQVSQRFHGDLERYQPGGTTRLRHFRFADQSWFIQDDWKLRPHLTLSLGLRYEYHAPPAEHESLAGMLHQAAQITRASRIADLEVQRTARWYNGDYNNFAPRFGFAWAIGGDRKTVMRAHYGILYERPMSLTVTLADNFTPGFSATRVVLPNEAPGSDHRLSDGIPPLQVPAVPPVRLPNTRREDIGIFDPHLRTGYVQQYGLSIQSELWRDTVMEVGFVGNRGVKLLLPVNVNQLRIYDDFLPAFREIEVFRAGGPAVSPGNTLVRLFRSVNQAVSSLQATFVDQGSAGAAANRLDTTFYSLYAAAGLSDH